MPALGILRLLVDKTVRRNKMRKKKANIAAPFHEEWRLYLNGISAIKIFPHLALELPTIARNRFLPPSLFIL